MAAKMPELTYSCEICGVEGLNDDEMRTHVLLHVGGAASCPFCDLSDITSEELLVHVNSTHLDYLTPENELLTFIDDDDDENFSVSPVSPNVSKINGWSEKNLHTNNNINNDNNNISDFNRPSGSGIHGEGSPLRSQLNLNLRGRQAVPAVPPPSLPPQDCPMCSYASSSPFDLEEHINRAHFDLTSPSLSSASATATATSAAKGYVCPLCVRTFQSSPDLELHVNLEHRDILSPAKPGVSTSNIDDWSERCPVCCRSSFRNNQEMVSHIEAHFDGDTPPTPDVSTDQLLAREMERRDRETRLAQEQREFELLRAQYGMDNQGNFKEQSRTNMQKAVYAGEMSVADYYERQMGLRAAEHSGVDDGSSCTKSLLPKIRGISANSPAVVRTLLCTTVDHYGSTYGDKGWGCGYRNIQMMISSLMHHTGYNEQLYKPAILGGGLFGQDNRSCGGSCTMPSISRLQQHLEWAWRQGFDVQGAEQLGGKLYNTRKWIGATEVVTALSSLRIRCQLVDFHQPSSPDGSHPELFNWVLQYFQRHEDFKPPLYLQHQGHSRTIVGAEQYRDGHVSLIVFDPSHTPDQMVQLKSTATSVTGMRLIRKTSAAMKARQYQLVAVCGIMETQAEYEDSKLLRSIRVPMDR